MIVKLSKYWTEKLLRFPESGMGYQKVEVRLKNGEVIHESLVYNAEELSLPSKKKINISEVEDIIVEEAGKK